jgi:hypothetical protein
LWSVGRASALASVRVRPWALLLVSVGVLARARAEAWERMPLSVQGPVTDG